MRWKTTLVLLALTIGIGAYVSLYDLKQPTPERQEQLSKEIIRLPEDSVTQLIIELPQGKATLIREGSVWRLVPQKARADASVIERMLRDFNPLEVERRLPEAADHPLDPKSFGLDPAVGWITLIAQGTPTTFLVGAATPVGHNRYLQISGRPEIFVISPQLFDDANQPLETFRDHQLIRPDPSAAEGITLTSQTTSFTLVRHPGPPMTRAGAGGDWDLTHPMQDRADQAAVSKVVSNLRKIAIKRFVNDALPAEQLATWGLDHPRAEVSLSHLGNASTSITLAFGAPLPDEKTLVYAKRSDEPSLYAVAASEVDALLKDPQGLRAKDCFDASTSAVTQVEVLRNGAVWKITKTGDRWLASGVTAPLDAQRVGEFLGQLTDLRLSGFVDDAPKDLTRYGLASPEGVLSVWTSRRDQPQQLLVGKTLAGSTNRYGRIQGRDAIVRLPDRVTELLATTLEALRPPAPASTDGRAGRAAPP